AILIWQEFSQRIRVFDERRLHGLEAIEFVDGADLRHHLIDGADVGRMAVEKPAREPCLYLIRLVRHAENPSLLEWKPRPHASAAVLTDKHGSGKGARLKAGDMRRHFG